MRMCNAAEENSAIHLAGQNYKIASLLCSHVGKW